MQLQGTARLTVMITCRLDIKIFLGALVTARAWLDAAQFWAAETSKAGERTALLLGRALIFSSFWLCLLPCVFEGPEFRGLRINVTAELPNNCQPRSHAVGCNSPRRV